MNRKLLLGTGALALTALFIRCTPGATQDASLSLTAKPKTIQNDGMATSVITVTASDEMAAAGTGTVHLTSSAGSLSAGMDVTLSNGTGTADFTCDIAMDNGCTGKITVTGVWTHAMKSVTGTVVITVIVPDAGVDAGEDAGSDAGPVPDAGYAIQLTTPRNRIFLNVGDFADFTIALRRGDAGPVVPNSDIDLTATIGGWTGLDGGTPMSPMTINTGPTGLGEAHFQDMAMAGTAMVTATHAPTGATRTTTVEIATIQQISWQGLTCKGTACTILGLKGSGNETGIASFKVTDNMNRVVPGVPVTFSLVNPPSGTNINPTVAITDVNGVASTAVSAGNSSSAFSIHAVVIPGVVEGDSPNIGIRGVKPSNKGFGLACTPVNISALECNANCPAAYNVTCKVTLQDRFGVVVGTGTSVNVKAEVGRVPASVATVAFNPAMTANPAEGTGSFTYDTNAGSNLLPVDVAPFPAQAQGAFMPRQAEPSQPNGGLTANPRDGMVTIIAYVAGEEYFNDSNNNGIRDGTEQFLDQGEPFVDSNDNGVWDLGEDFVDFAPTDGGQANGVWDPPNGQWDSSTIVWTESRIVWTSDPKSVVFGPATPFSPATCPAGLPKGQILDILLGAPDKNLNAVMGGSVWTLTRTGSRGMASIANGTIGDIFGASIDRHIVDGANPDADCVASSPRCVWRLLFFGWSGGFTSGGSMNPTSLHLVAPATTDTGMCANDLMTLKISTNGIATQGMISGAWQ